MSVVNPHACAGLQYSLCLSVILSVCLSVSLSVARTMAASNGHKSSSRTTKRGIGMGSVAFSDVILLKSLSTKHETKK